MIFFVGAGPGDPDLITVKGRGLIEAAEVIIYAGSLVSERHLDYAREDCKIYNSATMTLEEVMDVMLEADKKKYLVVRLHTGDPSIYGAIGEQMRELDKHGVYYEVVPGVSSFVAANAAVKKEMTLPGVSQTIILTRIKGRTDVPEKEKLSELARHKASMAIFLSVGKIKEVMAELLDGGYSEGTPVAVVYRATWSDEKIIMSTIKDIAARVEEENIGRQAQILVGDFLNTDFELSRLYDKTFTTEYRKGTDD